MMHLSFSLIFVITDEIKRLNIFVSNFVDKINTAYNYNMTQLLRSNYSMYIQRLLCETVDGLQGKAEVP